MYAVCANSNRTHMVNKVELLPKKLTLCLTIEKNSEYKSHENIETMNG